MPDISMCRDFTCPSRESCYRYRAVPNERRQTYAEFDRGGEDRCGSFQPVFRGQKRIVPMNEIEKERP